MMKEIIYRVLFYSEWHCGSGLGMGAAVDASVIKDENQLPYVPGKTLKGLLREAGEVITELGFEDSTLVDEIFGTRTVVKGASIPGKCFFSNAEFSEETKREFMQTNEYIDMLYRTHTTTAIDENGQAKEHSLRTIETVIPVSLYARIASIPDTTQHTEFLEMCMKYTKRLGVGRNRGLGRCDISIVKEIGK